MPVMLTSHPKNNSPRHTSISPRTLRFHAIDGLTALALASLDQYKIVAVHQRMGVFFAEKTLELGRITS